MQRSDAPHEGCMTSAPSIDVVYGPGAGVDADLASKVSATRKDGLWIS